MNRFKDKYRIQSARASWHDYNSGAYFVTICTAEQVCCFGTISDGKMLLSDMGKAAKENLTNISSHYPHAEIPLFVVMPNHIHAVVIINADKCNSSIVPNISNAANVETMCTSSLQPRPSQQARWKTETVDNRMREISHKRGALSVVIGGFKRAMTCHSRQNNIPFAWQSRFHERIIRNTDEMNHIAEYIENNVAKWDLDKLNKTNNDVRI